MIRLLKFLEIVIKRLSIFNIDDIMPPPPLLRVHIWVWTYSVFWWRKTPGAALGIVTGMDRTWVEPPTLCKIAGQLLHRKDCKSKPQWWWACGCRSTFLTTKPWRPLSYSILKLFKLFIGYFSVLSRNVTLLSDQLERFFRCIFPNTRNRLEFKCYSQFTRSIYCFFVT